ncbi:MAG: hypothetical protein LBC74_04820 [Planctomycetaceae bacterium]|jgi:hypothetical protein|nr:hypothetical protein [Planctomycetaceae bacterium]
MYEQQYNFNGSSEIEVDDLMRNAELRAEMEPYFDESVSRIFWRSFPIRFENEFLASMLDWEVAPVEPIYRWFDPELRIPSPESLTNEKLSLILIDLINKLFEKKIVLDFSDHLSDRELYVLIYRGILPSREKNLRHRNGYIHWDCSYGDAEVWLSYYASDDDREQWSDSYGEPLPPKQIPRYHRDLPQRPF